MSTAHQHEDWQIRDEGNGPYCAACGDPVDGRERRSKLIQTRLEPSMYARLQKIVDRERAKGDTGATISSVARAMLKVGLATYLSAEPFKEVSDGDQDS